jgi:hypothetical protein
MARRPRSRRDELGFYPFVVTDEFSEYCQGANTSEEASECAKNMLRDDGCRQIVIYQAVKKVEAEPVEVEVTGVSF